MVHEGLGFSVQQVDGHTAIGARKELIDFVNGFVWKEAGFPSVACGPDARVARERDSAALRALR
jgi:hypothetical protein